MTIRLLTRTEIRNLAKELDFRPRKALGQNFVHDANTLRRIVTASGITKADHVLEVGPGLGSLTLALLDRGAEVDAAIHARHAGLVGRRREAGKAANAQPVALMGAVGEGVALAEDEGQHRRRSGGLG